MKLTIVSDNRVLAEQFHMKSGSYSSCQLFFPFILLIIIPLSHHCVQCMGVQAPFALGSVLIKHTTQGKEVMHQSFVSPASPGPGIAGT